MATRIVVGACAGTPVSAMAPLVESRARMRMIARRMRGVAML